MASRLTYRWLRLIHRYSGLALMTFLLMYFITGWVMVHEPWWNHPKAEVHEARLYLPPPPALAEGKLPDYFADTLGLTGRLDRMHTRDDGSLLLEFHHPGRHQRLVYFPDTDSVHLRDSYQGPRGVIHGLHRTHGYGGGWVYTATALAMDLCGLALLLFVATGIWLWLKLIPQRGWGLLMLALGSGFTIWVIAALWAQ